MAEITPAKRLLALAEEHDQAYARLVLDPKISDAVLGYHAHQAVEKALKAVLAMLATVGIPYRDTHDIAELLDLLEDKGFPSPPDADRLDELSPFALEMRYGFLEPTALDWKQEECDLDFSEDDLSSGLVAPSELQRSFDALGTQDMIENHLAWTRAIIP